MAADPTGPAIASYSLSPRRRAIILGIATALLAVPVLIAVADPKSGGAASIIFLAMSPCLIITVFIAWYPRLTVSADGLRMRGGLSLSTLFIPWSNLERIRLKPYAEGLILRDPLTSRAAASWKNWAGLRYAGAPFFDPEQQRYILEQRFVQMQAFAHWFHHGNLLEQILQFAPWIADDLKNQEPTYDRGKIRERRNLLWVFMITGLISLVAAGVGVLYSQMTADQRAAFDRGEAVVGRVVGWGIGLALTVYALINVRACWRFARRKQFGYAALWLLIATIQILLALMSIGLAK